MNITHEFLSVARRASVALFAIAFAFSVGAHPAHAADPSQLTVTTSTITYGDSAEFTATLVDGMSAGISGATIEFYLDGNPVSIGSDTTDGSGEASISVSDISAGTHSVTAEFAGDMMYEADSDSTSLEVEQLLITVTGLSADNKVYDGNSTAQISGTGSLSGVLAGDVADVTLAGTPEGDFDDETADTGKTVTITGLSLTGAKAANYEIDVLTDTADIEPLPVSVEISADDRDYDATTDATVTYDVVSPIGMDDVEASGSASFDTKDVGTGKLVTATGISLSGSDSDNYTLTNTTATTTASIDPAPLSATVTVFDKDYDDTTAATINTITAVGLQGGESVTITGGVAEFDTQHAGTQNVSITGLVLTPDAVSANYDFTDSATATATINPLNLTVTAVTDTKVYDGSTSSTGSPIVTGIIVGNDTPSFTQAYATAGAGTGKTINASGAVNDGNGGNNYNVMFVADTTGVITGAPLTITADDLSKVYGSANPTATASYSGFVGGEDEGDLDTGVTLVIVANAFSDVGNHVITAFGAADANYIITHENGNLVVTPYTLTANASATNKVYDGTVDASASVSPVGMLFTDVVTASHSYAEFDTADVGAGKTVTLYGVTLGGTDAGNYTIASTATASADITERDITVTADAASKVYGESDPTFTYSVTSGSLVSGDSFSGELDRAVGEDVGTYAIGQGTLDAGANYTITYVGNDFSITPASLTVTADDKTKAYLDPLPTFTATITGYQNGDDEADLDSGVSFSTTADSNSVTGTYTITPFGVVDSNYTVAHVNGTLTIVEADQTIDFDPLADKNFGDSNFVVAATASSGLPVYFSASGSCTISVDEVHIVTKGTCTITAHQDGDSNWNPAPDVSQSFEVYDVVAPTLTRVGSHSIEVYLTPGGTYTDPGVYATDDVDASVPVITTGTVDMETLGTYILTFDASDSSGNAAVSVSRSVTVIAPHTGGGGGGASVGGSAPSQGGEVLGASDFQFTRQMGMGATGTDVTELQKLLTALGFYKGPITGYYGPLTEAAVRAFQAARGIPQTGYVGPLTLAALNAADVPAGNAVLIADIEAKIKALQEELAKMLAN